MRSILVALVCVSCSAPKNPQPVDNDKAGGKQAGTSGDVLRYLPASSNGIIHADLAAIRATPFGVRADAFLNETLADLALGDRIAKVASITYALGWDGSQFTQAHHVMVVRGPTLDDVRDALVIDGKKPRMERDGAIVRAVYDDGSLTFAYPEERVILFFMFEATPPVESLRKLVADGAPLRKNPDFMARFDKVSAGQVWTIANIDPFDLVGLLASPALPALFGVRAAYARIQVGQQVEVWSQHVAPDRKTAAELVKNTRRDQADSHTLLGELLANSTGPQVDADAEVVRVAFTLTDRQVTTGREIWARWFQRAGK